jgi:ATP-dependent RNA helicase RhlB
MDFHRYGIDARLAEAAESLKIDFFFYEKLLAHALENGENVCAKIVLGEGREEVLLLPALQWLLSGEVRKLLVLAQDERSGDRCVEAIGRLGASAGIGVRRARRDAEGAVALEGDSAAAVLVCCFDELLSLFDVDLHDYGYLVVDGADRIAEQPSQAIHKLVGLLLPPWERRCLLACAKISVKAKNLARDLADNPVEIAIDGEVIKAQSVAKETWNIAGEDKLKFLLGLIEREKPDRVCVFCNLKDTAKEVSMRLQANSLGSDYILGALALDRKRAVLASARSGEKPCLVLTDQGAEGLGESCFPVVVNFDIPLEPELFVRRLEMLDRDREGAKVVSLACDRYIYGLSAVESYIEAKLEARPVDESLIAVADKSEGMVFEPRERRGDERRGGAEGDSRRGDERSGGRGQQQRDSYRRDSQSRRDSQHGGSRADRSPDIRRSISEATGGSLDFGASSSPSPAPRGKDEARGQPPQRGSGDRDRRGGQRPQNEPSRKRGASPRNDRGGKAQARQQESQRRSQAPRPAGGAPGSGNPYDLSIEERMKRYREKYGQDLGANRQEKRPPRAQHPSPRGNAEARPPRDRTASAPSRPSQQPTPEPKPQGGFLGQLFGSFKKRGK